MGKWNSLTFNVMLVGFSPKAILVAVKGHSKGVWLPDQYISHDEDVRVGEWFDVTMPRWLAEQRGLI